MSGTGGGGSRYAQVNVLLNFAVRVVAPFGLLRPYTHIQRLVFFGIEKVQSDKGILHYMQRA